MEASVKDDSKHVSHTICHHFCMQKLHSGNYVSDLPFKVREQLVSLLWSASNSCVCACACVCVCVCVCVLCVCVCVCVCMCGFCLFVCLFLRKKKFRVAKKKIGSVGEL